MIIRLFVTLAVGIVFGAVLSCNVRQPEAQGQAQEKAQRWEYKEVNMDHSDGSAAVVKRLNDAGEEGWELASVAGPYGIMKRPKR
jgi:hypothetical protein